MKVLFIGGTGIISTACTALAAQRGMNLTLLSRGQHAAQLPPGAKTLIADINDPALLQQIEHESFDAVVDWIAFTPADIERDLQLFRGRTRQFVFISSASAYQKPQTHYLITESTPLANPHWDYSRNKIACEERLMHAYRDDGFPAHEQAIGQAFHITSDEVLTWDQLFRIVGAASGVEPKLVHIPSDFIATCIPEKKGTLIGDKSVSVVFDNSKIKRFVPGYCATTTFAEGVRQSLAWFNADPSRKQIDHEVNATLDRLIAAYEKGM